jgi:hypothetical protein
MSKEIAVTMPLRMLEEYLKHRQDLAKIPDVFRFSEEAEEICWRAYYEWMGRAANYAIEAALKKIEANSEASK